MFVLTCIALQRSTHLKEVSYFSIQEVRPGTLVEVPYRKSTLVAVVVRCATLAHMKGDLKNIPFKLKNITRIIPRHYFSPHVFGAAEQYQDDYHVPQQDILDMCIPRSFTTWSLAALEHQPEQNPPHDTHHIGSLSDFHITLLQQGNDERVSTYRSRAREVLSTKTSMVIISPSAHRCRSLYTEIARGIEQHVVTLHPLMTSTQIRETYQRIHEHPSDGHGLVIITTPYFIGCLPMTMSLCIVDEANAQQYLSAHKPVVDTRKVIEFFARSTGIECMFADVVVPLTLASRVDFDPLVSWYGPASYRSPTPHTMDMVEHEFSDDTMIHDGILDDIVKTVDQNNNVMVYVPRTGYASITTCQDCHQVVSCPECNAPLRLVSQKKSPRIHTCHRCKHQVQAVDVCTNCEGSRFALLGITIEKIVEYLSTRIDPEKILTVSNTTLSTKKFTKQLHASYDEGGFCFVGTQSLLQLPFSYPLTVVPSVAHLLGYFDFQSYEQALRLRSRLHEMTTDRIVFQTTETYRDLASTYITTPLSDHIMFEKKLRKDMSLPPHTQVIRFVFPQNSKSDLQQYIKSIGIEQRFGCVVSFFDRIPYRGYTKGSCVDIMGELSNERIVQISEYLQQSDTTMYRIPLYM